MDRNDRQAWLLVAMAIAAMACMMWLFSLDRAHAAAHAQGANYCPPGEVMSPNIAPWPGYDGPGTCAICCDRPDGSGYWYRMPNWHRVCYPNRRPAATPTRRPTRRPTATPSATATNTAVPPTETPTATQTPTEAPGPVFPVPPVQGMPPSQAMPTATTQPTGPPLPSATPGAQQIRTLNAWRPQCLPRHAARPIALCRSGSGSGWWLYFIGPGGRIETGPHVPFPTPAMAGRRAVLRHYISGEPIVLVWYSDRLQVRTAYEGKAYIFDVDRAGNVHYLRW